MKNFIAQYIRIIAYTTIGLILLVSGFYIMINYYHSQEVKNNLYIADGEINLQNYNSKIEEIERNLNKFNSKNATQVNRNMYNKLNTCTSVLKSEGTFKSINYNSYYNSVDIYKLGSKVKTDLLNVCWVLHLSYITGEDAPEEFKTIAPYIQNSIDMISKQTSFALEEIQNNSSYFYTTSVTSSTIRNYLSSDYQIIANSYNKFADILLELSKLINEGGNKDDQNY